MIFVATDVPPRIAAGAAPQCARPFVLAGAFLVLAACNGEPPAGDPEPAPDAAMDASPAETAETARTAEPAAGEAATEGLLDSGTDCPVLESRNWSARIEGGGDTRRLQVSGEIDLPTPGYSASWSEGPADRRMPPAQHLLLELTAPTEMVAQVVTRLPVEYEGVATYAEYRAILVRCGSVVLASITDIEVPD